MRAPRATFCLLTLFACSDGVGTPIRQRAAESASDDDDAGDERVDEGGAFDARHCAPTLDWPAEYAADEARLLVAINALRAQGFRCGDNERDDLPPLVLSPALQCSARLHSLDMVLRNFTRRTNPDDEGPSDRIRAAGFAADDWDESIAAGERTAQAALLDLLDDEDDCINVGTRRLTHIGIGRFEDRWTLDFARD